MKSKKKLILLLGTVLGLSTSALIAVASFSRGGLFEKEVAKDDGNFSLDMGTIKQSATETDVYTAAMLSNMKNTVNIKISGVSQVNEQIVAEKENYFFISNLEDSPIRGISQLQLYGQALNTSSASIYVNAYFSYNPLNINDILDGKYQDLVVKTLVNNVYSDAMSAFYNPISVNGSLNARYFLLAIGTIGDDVSLMGLMVNTPCEDEPVEVPVGEYPHSYGEEIDAILPDDFPFIGNGSFVYQFMSAYGMGYDIWGLQRSGKHDEFYYDTLVSNGYQLVTQLQGYDCYQKFHHDDLYTTVLDIGYRYQFDGYEIMDIIVLGDLTNLVAKAEWPATEIDTFFSATTFTDIISSPSFPSGTTYSTVSQSTAIGSQFNVIINAHDFEISTLQEIVSTFNDVKNSIALVGYVETNYYNYGSLTPDEDGSIYRYIAYSFISPDLQYQIDATFGYLKDGSTGEEQKMIEFAFTKYVMTTFPADELIELFGEDYFPAIPGSILYRIPVNGTDVVPEDFTVKKSTHYITGGFTDEIISDYFAELVKDGWVIDGQTAIKILSNDPLPYAIRIRIRSYATYFHEIIFEYGVASYSFGSLVSAINYGYAWDYDAMHLVYNLESEVDLGSGDFYIASSTENSKTILCRNRNAEQLESILNVCEWNEKLNAYVFYSSSVSHRKCLFIDGSVVNDCLVLTIEVVDYSIVEMIENLVDANTANTTFKQNLEHWGVYEPEASIYQMFGEGEHYIVDEKEPRVTILYDNYEAALNSANSYKSNLTNNGLLYSKYLGQYVNLESNIGVTISEITSTYGYYIYTISINTGVYYTDYATYSDINISDFEYFDYIPTLELDGKHYIENYSYDKCIELYVDEEFYQYYSDELIKDGYSYENSGKEEITKPLYFSKIDSAGNYCEVQFSKSSYDSYRLRIYFEYQYYNDLQTVKDAVDNDDLWGEFVYPTDSGLKYHYNYSDYTSISMNVSNIDISAYRDLLTNSGYSMDGGNTFYRIDGNARYRIYVSDDYISYYKDIFAPLYDEEGFIDELESNGFDTTRLDRFIIDEQINENIYVQSIGEQYFEISIFGEFDINSYVAKINESGMYHEGKENEFYSLDGDTSIRYYLDCGVYRIEYSDYRIIYKTYDEIISKIKASHNMLNHRLDKFVNPEQDGELYSLNYCNYSDFSLRYDPDGFDVDAYVNKLVIEGFSQSEKDQYNLTKDNTQIRINTSSNYIYFYNYDSINYDYEEAIRHLSDYDYFDLTILNNFVNPEQDNAEYYHASPYSSNSFELSYVGEKFDAEAYRAKVLSAGYTPSGEVGPEGSYFYEKDGNKIAIYTEQCYINFTASMSFEDVIDKAVNHGFKASKLEYIPNPGEDFRATQFYSGKYQLEIYYVDGTFDVDAYKYELVNTYGFVLDESESWEDNSYYYKDGARLIIDTESNRIALSSNYTVDELYEVMNSDIFNDNFVAPEQNTLFYDRQSYDYDYTFKFKYATGTLDVEEYVQTLENAGYEYISDPELAGAHELSNGLCIITITNQEITLRVGLSVDSLKDYLSNYYGTPIEALDRLIDPAQEGTAYFYYTFYDEYWHHYGISYCPTNFSVSDYVSLLVDGYGYTDNGVIDNFRVLSNGDIYILIDDDNCIIEFYNKFTWDELREELINRGYNVFEKIPPEIANDLASANYDSCEVYPFNCCYLYLSAECGDLVNQMMNHLSEAGYELISIDEDNSYYAYSNGDFIVRFSLDYVIQVEIIYSI